MPITEYSGVVINKLTLAQYKELKAAGQTVASQTYVFTDIDKYIDFLVDEYDKTTNLFDINRLSKLTFSPLSNTVSSFIFAVYDDANYTNLLAWLSIEVGYLQGECTFTINTSGYYMVRVGLNGDVSDDKQDLWFYFEAGTYTVSCMLTNNVLNSCTLSSIMLNKGSSALSHKDYKGKIVHEKDIPQYWQLRTGRVITNSDCIFFNTNKTDFTDVPLGNLIQKNDQNGNVYYLKFLKTGNTYKLVRANSSGSYSSSDVLASGNRDSMTWNRTFVIYSYNVIGYYSQTTILINNTNIIDNLFRINNTNF